jgi:hypothetical protein
MNRRDYRAHVEWSDSIRADRCRHANRHAVRPPVMPPRRTPARWRGFLAALAVGLTG